MSDKTRQSDEIEVLESIYDKDLIVFSRWPSSGCLRISPDPVAEEFIMNVVNIVNERSIERTIKLRYLAPIELYFKCPTDYPSKSQPLFMLKCIWLPEDSQSVICRNLDSVWDRARSEILYDWAYFLKDCCSLLDIDKLNFTINVNESNIVSISSSHLLEPFDNLKLKELKNKPSKSKNLSESHCQERIRKKKYRRTRERKLHDNFKYETPTDVKIPTGENHLCTRKETMSNGVYCVSSLPTTTCPSSITDEFILAMLPTYGIRRKTLFNDRDSRIIPNYEEAKPDKHGIRGASLIVQKMIEYNDECIIKTFRHQSHFCGICFEEKQGLASVRVQLCGHIFCRECVLQYLNVNITNGNLRALQCPDVDCGMSFTVAQIRQTVDENMYKKFEEFARKITVEDDPNLLYCPRDVCQSVARRCPQLGSEICFCSRCCFYFCLYCKRAYHGVQPCQLQNENKLKVIREYLSADSSRQNELEKRYSKQQIRKWVDEHLTTEWIKESSKPCPNCEAPIQKNDGCNKMLCLNCSIPFCWLCDKCLSSARPYDHFTDVHSPCYQKLFNVPETDGLSDFEDEDFWVDEFADEE